MLCCELAFPAEPWRPSLISDVSGDPLNSDQTERIILKPQESGGTAGNTAQARRKGDWQLELASAQLSAFPVIPASC